MPEGLAARLTVVSLNTRGVPVIGSHLAGRYAVIGAALEAGDARRMGSFRYVSWRPSPTGPAGGLVTFSRLPISSTVYRGLGLPPRAPGISGAARWRAALKGVLVTRLARLELCVLNTHPVANRDGDWSRAGRFYPLHRAQLATLARTVRGVGVPVVVCGDFNVDRDSSLLGEFMAETGLTDTFAGIAAGHVPAFIAAELIGGAAASLVFAWLLDDAGRGA